MPKVITDFPDLAAADNTLVPLPYGPPVTAFLLAGHLGTIWHYDRGRKHWTAAGHPNTYPNLTGLARSHGPMRLTGQAAVMNPGVIS